MSQAYDINRLTSDLTEVSEVLFNIIRNLAEMQEAEKPATTNNPIMSALADDSTRNKSNDPLDFDPSIVCCSSGNTTYNFSQEQYNHILGMLGGSFLDKVSQIMKILIRDGKCVVDYIDVVSIEQRTEYGISVEPTPGSVGCYTYTFDLTKFLASAYFQSTLRLHLESLSKTIMESTRQFNELSILQKS